MSTHISPVRRSETPWLALERPSWLPYLRTRAERVREGVIAGTATLSEAFSSFLCFSRGAAVNFFKVA